jgi:hypothetical protein
VKDNKMHAEEFGKDEVYGWYDFERRVEDKG